MGESDGAPLRAGTFMGMDVHWDAEQFLRCCLHTLSNRILAFRLQVHLLEGVSKEETQKMLPDMFAVLGRSEQCIGLARELLQLKPAGRPGPLVLKEAVEHLKGKHPRLQATVIGDIPGVSCLPYGVEDWLGMLEPLLENSWEAEATCVECSANCGEDGGMTLAVCDNGRGFHLPPGGLKIEPYLSAKQGHHGLGLCRVARMAAVGGGSLRLGARTGGGAVVELRFGA